MNRFFRKRWVKVLVSLTIGVPAASLGSLYLYIHIRQQTKPPEHIFKPLIHVDGTLIMNDGKIPPPSKLKVFLRILELISIFLPVWILYFFMRGNDESYEKWCRRLLHGVERAGPAFVKMGQWACTRNDLFDPIIRGVFKKLFSEVKTHPFSESVRLIESDLGQPINQVFRNLDAKPIGSGSIGQVHSGYLHTGEKVAVKVMHPNAVETISKDFFVVNMVATFIENHVPSLAEWDMKKQAYNWTNHLAAQLDFRVEAEHLELFRKHFQDVDYVYFPKPFRSTQHVLIEEWVPGEPATEEFLSSQQDHVRDILATKGLNCYCKMLLRDNFIHGDMHPGNILVDTSDPHHPFVSMIDVGLCQKLNHEEAKLTHDYTASFVYWDSQMSGNAMWDMGQQRFCKDKQAFLNDFHDMFEKYRPVPDTQSDCIAMILQSCFDCARIHRVSLDPQYVTLLWSLLVLEGFIMALDPNYNMVRHCAPWLLTEGHVSVGQLKNIVLSSMETTWQKIRIMRGVLHDGMHAGEVGRRLIPNW